MARSKKIVPERVNPFWPRNPKKLHNPFLDVVGTSAWNIAKNIVADTVGRAIKDKFKPKPYALPFSTPTGGTLKVAVARRRGQSYGKYAGFTRRPRRMGRGYRRRYRKAFNGVQFNQETAGNVTDDRCVYIGHHSTPITTLCRFAVYAVFKKLLNVAGIHPVSWDDIVVGTLVNLDQVVITWKNTPVAPEINTNIVFTIIAGTTYRDLAEAVWSAIAVNFLTTSSFSAQARFTQWSLSKNLTQEFSLNMTDCTVSVLIKSALKMQNRSIALVGDDEADNINNVPLNGKCYEFKGNVMVPRSGTSLDIADNVTGLQLQGAGSSLELQEPPEPFYFASKPKVAKVKLQPGSIKTSVLTFKKNLSFNYLMRFANGLYRAGTADLFNPMGNSRLFAFERMIARLGTEIAPGIVVTYEHDIKYYIAANVKRGEYLGPINSVL